MLIPVIFATLGISFMVEAGRRPWYGRRPVFVRSVQRRSFEVVGGRLVRLDKPEYLLVLSERNRGTRRVELVLERGHLVPSGRTSRGTDVPVWARNFAWEHTAEIIAMAKNVRVSTPLLRRLVESEAWALLEEEGVREIVEQAERGPARGRDQRVIDALLAATIEAEYGWRYGDAGLVGPYALP
jgi:hypothetical protein